MNDRIEMINIIFFLTECSKINITSKHKHVHFVFNLNPKNYHRSSYLKQEM
jgi:hypothetical protein